MPQLIYHSIGVSAPSIFSDAEALAPHSETSTRMSLAETFSPVALNISTAAAITLSLDGIKPGVDFCSS